MNDFLAYLVKNLVDNPDQVVVTIQDGEQTSIAEIRVAEDDIAKLVGRQGRTIKALRTLAATVSARFGRKIRIEVIQAKEEQLVAASSDTPEE